MLKELPAAIQASRRQHGDCAKQRRHRILSRCR
jgi:hypothetical protein